MRFHRPTPVSWILPLLATLLSACTAEDMPNAEQETDSYSDGDSNIAQGTDPPPWETPPCAFGAPYYTRVGEGLDFIEATDPFNPDCKFAFHFAERLSDGSVAMIAEEGESPKIFDIPGFMIATLDFACDANSTRRCTADAGDITLTIFEITADDLTNDTISGRSVRIDIDARGTAPGNVARFQGAVEGTLP